MSSVVLQGDTSGQVTLAVPEVAGSNTVTIPASTGTAALTSDVIGISQTWTDVTASRVAGTTYTNSTGKPIAVSIRCSTSGASPTLTVGGVAIQTISNATVTSVSGIVPNGTTYLLSATSGFSNWLELR